MNLRRILPLLLVMSLLLPACTPDTPTDTQAPDTTTIDAAETTEAVIEELPPKTFDGATWRVLHYDSTFSRYYFDPEDAEADLLSEAAYRRNITVEDMHKVVIEEAAGKSNKCAPELLNDVAAGGMAYDAIVPQSSEGYAALITQGAIADLSQLSDIKLDEVWWYPEVKDLLTIGGHLYFTGSYYTTACTNIFALLYNKELITTLGLENPSQKAIEGEWYYDDMLTLMAAATEDLNGDGTMDGTDRYGLLTASNLMYTIPPAFAFSTIDFDEDGKPVIAELSDKWVGIYDRLNALVTSPDVYFGNYKEQAYITQTFAQGSGLFALFGLGSYYPVLRGLDLDYGLLPLPKYDENQKSYAALRMDSYVGVPSVTSDHAKSATVLESLTELSYTELYPVFANKVLDAQSLQDPESSKLLDIIMGSFFYDLSFPYVSANGRKHLVRLITDKEVNLASSYAKGKDSVQKELDTLYEAVLEQNIVIPEYADTTPPVTEETDFTVLTPEEFVLSQSEELMEGWPDLLKTQTGKIISVFNQCVGHGNRNHSRITLRESTDNGKTWSERRFIGPETQQGDQWNSIRISQLSDGRIIVVCDRIDNHERTDTTEMWLFESSDDGKTWTEGKALGIYGYCSDRVRELSDGTLLMLVSSYNSTMGRSVVYAHRSTDGGKTWSERINVALDARYNLIEPAVLETSDGTLVAFIRENSSKDYNCIKVISKDGGLTWSDTYQMAIPACHRPSVGYLSDGRIMLTYRYYFNKTKRISGIAIFDEASALETDVTKQVVELYQFDYDEAEKPDTGYTAWVEYEPGKLLLANYITANAARPFIRGYFLDVADLKLK